MIPVRFFSSLVRLLLLCGLPLTVSTFTAGAPVDLGDHLIYMRLHGRPDDVAALAAAWRKPALIVDLRYPAAGAAQFLPADIIPSRPRSAPLFVLVGPGTSAHALAALRERAPALITLGLPAPGLAPDIGLTVKPEDDRRAYEALDSGTPVGTLLSEHLTKQRFDEAALMHERAQGPDRTGAPADDPAPAAPKASPAQDHPAADAPPAEPKDVVLQRAVQLYRALLVLGKLPRT
jgi:hypothetical protein